VRRRDIPLSKQIQGFLTSKNRFLNRKEAAIPFRAQGGHPLFPNELYSEDLY
jgi:hypothetical protein